MINYSYMYAVYGLKENRSEVEQFLGYIPASFFDQFTDQTGWTVSTITLNDGRKAVGRVRGRAFFVSASNLRASKSAIEGYMGVSLSDLTGELE